MDPEGGAESVENLRQAGNGHGRMYIVPHAGHHRKSSLDTHLIHLKVLTCASFSLPR